jgi:hypothetical protein
MIVALKFPENEAWLESKEKAVSARTTSGSKTWTMFGSSLSLAPGPAGAGLGRKVSDRSIKDEDELVNNNNNNSKDEDNEDRNHTEYIDTMRNIFLKHYLVLIFLIFFFFCSTRDPPSACM